MKKLMMVCAMAALVFAMSGVAQATSVTISMYATPAPDAYSSASWTGYRDNVLDTLNAGGTSYGTPATDPEAFYTVSPTGLDMTDLVTTEFASWDGLVSPSSPFDGEYGQRMHFAWVITSTTANDDISLSNVGNMEIYYLDTDEDTSEQAAFGDSATFHFSDYSASVIGVKADTSVVSSGAATTSVNKIIYVGYGLSWDAYHDISETLTDQEVLDTLLADLGDGSLEYLRGTVSYDDGEDVTDAELKISAIPEPASVIFFGTGLVGVFGFLSRRRMRKA